MTTGMSFGRRACGYLFFAGMVVFLYLRFMDRVSYFPPYFEGESARALDQAKATCHFASTHSWPRAVARDVSDYNKGYAWILVPFYRFFGYDVRLITFVLPVAFSVLVAAFFAIFRRVRPTTHLLAFLLVACSSVLCLCLRRYKWHSVTYLTALSVYIFFLPLFCSVSARRTVYLRFAAITLFFVGCYYYFGGLLYGPPLLALIFAYSSREQRRREVLWGSVGAAVIGVTFLLTFASNAVWRVRVEEVCSQARQLFGREDILLRLWTVREFFFTHLLSPPFLVIFAVGFGRSIWLMRKGDRFAQVNTFLFLSIWLFQLLIGGVANPDQLNWSMIPILGILLIGADTTLGWIRDRGRYGFAVGLCLATAAASNEFRRFPDLYRTGDQAEAIDRNTTTQAALVLRMIGEDKTNDVNYYMPDPSVPEAEGGFYYSTNLLRVDYAPALSKVTFFRGDDDLIRKIRSQVGNRTAVVYQSVGISDSEAADTLKRPLLGLHPTVIHPYEDIYLTQFLVRSYRFRASQVSAQVPVLSLKGMVLWLRSDGAAQEPGDLTVWEDQTGQAHDATFVRGGRPPRVIPGQVNGLPAVRFFGNSALRLPSELMKKAHAGRIIAVVRVGSRPDNLNVLWNLGTGWGSTYKDSLHFEDFGNGDTHAVPIETRSDFGAFFVYDTFVDADGILIYRANGQAQWTKHITHPGFQPYPDIGGYGYGSFTGDIAEIILYEKALDSAEEAAVYAYLGKKFAIPDLARNLGGPVILTSQCEGQVGRLLSRQIEARNHPDSFELLGLPAGLAISPSGVLSGTPIKEGRYELIVRATNASGTGSTPFTLIVRP